MNPDDIVHVGRDAMLVTLLCASPMLVSGLIVGLTISIFQSVTQIQEITLTFVPKIVVVLLSFVLFLPWILGVLIGFVTPIFGEAHLMVE